MPLERLVWRLIFAIVDLADGDSEPIFPIHVASNFALPVSGYCSRTARQKGWRGLEQSDDPGPSSFAPTATPLRRPKTRNWELAPAGTRLSPRPPTGEMSWEFSR